MFESCVLFGQQVSFTWKVGLFYLDTRSLLLMFESCVLSTPVSRPDCPPKKEANGNLLLIDGSVLLMCC